MLVRCRFTLSCGFVSKQEEIVDVEVDEDIDEQQRNEIIEGNYRCWVQNYLGGGWTILED